jgi:hypothetical protein
LPLVQSLDILPIIFSSITIASQEICVSLQVSANRNVCGFGRAAVSLPTRSARLREGFVATLIRGNPYLKNLYVTDDRIMQRRLLLGLLACLLVFFPGCGFLAQLGWIVTGGPKVKAEFSGLRGKRTAIVCVADSVSYGTGAAASMLARRVEARVRENVRDVKIITQDKIDQWKDLNDWDEFDYREIGQGVDAEMVVGIDLVSFRLHEGQTMYRGRAEVTVSVYDMTQGGELVFRRTTPEFTFPPGGGQHTTDTTESQFRTVFVEMLAQHITRHFHDYDFRSTVAQDSPSNY